MSILTIVIIALALFTVFLMLESRPMSTLIFMFLCAACVGMYFSGLFR